MTQDASGFAFRDEDATRIAASWESVCRRGRDGIDRVAIVACFGAALDGGSEPSLELAVAAAAFGVAYAASGGTQNGLVDELDALQSTLLDRIAERVEAAPCDARGLVAHHQKLHALAAASRRSAAAAFDHTLAAAARKRARVARHDIANAIGTVRNAILLMEDETTEASRDHFRTIAKRNSASSESLVRLHLSDRAALGAALGWEEIPLGDLSDRREASVVAGAVFTNTGALDTMLDAIHTMSGQAGSPHRAATHMSFAATSATSGVLTIQVPACADQSLDPRALDALRTLATAMGLKLEDDSSPTTLRLVLPLSAGNERHDLGGAGQGHHADAVGL